VPLQERLLRGAPKPVQLKRTVFKREKNERDKVERDKVTQQSKQFLECY